MAAYLRITTAILIFSLFIISIQAATESRCGHSRRSVLLNLSSHNLVLNNHVIRSYTNMYLIGCTAACMKEDSCVSINYGETGGICELNASHKEDHPGDVEEKVGWMYYGTQEKKADTEIIPTGTKALTTAAETTEAETTAAETTEKEITAAETTEETTAAAETTETSTSKVLNTGVNNTENIPVDCWEVQSRAPSSVSGVYSVYPHTRNGSLQVYCDMDMDGGGWTVFQRRKDDSQDFYLDWASYKAGFGDLTQNFWLGNDALNELTTQQDYHIRIELQSFTLESTYTKYGLFRVDNEINKYRLTLGTYYGSYLPGDSFTFHNGQFFSTLDRDNDIDTRHCAQTFLGAWWFAGCISSCLNGPYRTTSDVPSIGQGVVWGYWPDLLTSQKFAEMKIRPVSALSVARDCWDLYVMGETVSGIYSVQLTGRDQPLEVYCDMDSTGGGWTVIQRRQDGSQDFYLDWADYKAGFGSLNCEFWLGNDNIHLLTNQDSYQLTVTLTTWDTIVKYANYEVFVVANETDLYRLSIGGFSGSDVAIDDSLTYHNGFAWSTRDSENDIDDVRHCAQAMFGAWWYGACEMSNLNGPYVAYPGTLSVDNYGQGIMWGSWKFQSYSFPKAEMKIRPAHVDFPI